MSGESFDVRDPADGSVVGTVRDHTVEDGLAAVERAREAGAAWARRAPIERADVLLRAYRLLGERREEVARLIVRENGKPLDDALGEVDYAAGFFRWYGEEAVRLEGSYSTAPSGANRILVMREPIGVCLLITPWNFPAAMATRKLGPALAAGCSAILKPASETPLTAVLIGELLEEAGLPAGVVSVTPSRRSAAFADALLDHPAVRKLSFTGSTEVGRRLLAAAARTVVNCSMELGGNAPFIVFADADLEAAVEGALVAKMRNVGEACTAANRFYVDRAVAAEFGERLAARMGSLPLGPGLDPGVKVGPLINEGAIEKIEALVADAVERGAEVLVGGSRPDREGSFYEPTVVAGTAAGSEILREEIFGPVAPIVAFDTEDEVIALANQTEYGLVAYVYSGDLGRGLAVGEALEAGMVALNRPLVSDPAAPFGGVKQSGIGREGGHEGLLEFTEAKYFAIALQPDGSSTEGVGMLSHDLQRAAT
jgi:succinate-semialdehyde dehydrogenase / glutarate-semialdehyde dehydrogenase